jgi:hypothetical protein
VVRADAVLGGWAAGDLLRVWKGPAFHLRQDAVLVHLGFQKASVAVKLHQVENLGSEWNTVSLQKEPES